MVLRQPETHIQNNGVKTPFSHHTQKLKMALQRKYKVKIIKAFKKTGVNLHDLGLAMYS